MRKIFVIGIFLLTAVASVAGSTGYNYVVNDISGEVVITVEPSRTIPLDVLFVIDNSGSMAAHQENFAKYTDLFSEQLVNLKRDYHIGVTSTSIEQGSVDGSDGKLNGVEKVLTRSTVNLKEKLVENLKMGTQGKATETHFDVIKLALTEPNLSGANQGFYRANAGLVLVFLTDTEDQSSISEVEFEGFLKSLKGGSVDSITAFSWLIPKNGENANCLGEGVNPVRLERLTSEFNGQVYNLCDSPSYRDNMADFGTRLANFGRKAGTISRVPIYADPKFESIQVRYGSMILQKGDLALGWAFDPSTKEVVLGNKINWDSQPLGTKLEIRFVPIDWNK